jgi:hypothetical protein
MPTTILLLAFLPITILLLKRMPVSNNMLLDSKTSNRCEQSAIGEGYTACLERQIAHELGVSEDDQRHLEPCDVEINLKSFADLLPKQARKVRRLSIKCCYSS